MEKKDDKFLRLLDFLFLYPYILLHFPLPLFTFSKSEKLPSICFKPATFQCFFLPFQQHFLFSFFISFDHSLGECISFFQTLFLFFLNMINNFFFLKSEMVFFYLFSSISLFFFISFDNSLRAKATLSSKHSF